MTSSSYGPTGVSLYRMIIMAPTRPRNSPRAAVLCRSRGEYAFTGSVVGGRIGNAKTFAVRIHGAGTGVIGAVELLRHVPQA